MCFACICFVIRIQPARRPRNKRTRRMHDRTHARTRARASKRKQRQRLAPRAALAPVARPLSTPPSISQYERGLKGLRACVCVVKGRGMWLCIERMNDGACMLLLLASTHNLRIIHYIDSMQNALAPLRSFGWGPQLTFHLGKVGRLGIRTDALSEARRQLRGGLGGGLCVHLRVCVCVRTFG